MSSSEESQILATVYMREHDDSSRRPKLPKPRPDFKDNKDPDSLLLASDNRLDLIGLKFHEGESSYFPIIELSAPGGYSLQPAMHRIPRDLFDSSNGGLVQTLDTEGGNFIKRGPAVLESSISCPGCRT